MFLRAAPTTAWCPVVFLPLAWPLRMDGRRLPSPVVRAWRYRRDGGARRPSRSPCRIASQRAREGRYKGVYGA